MENVTMPRRGLTLLELVVVLTILVALAGLLVPMVSNLLSVSTSAIGATNASEIERMVQLYLGRPNGNTLDLLDNLAGSTGDLMSYVPTNSGTLGNATPDIVPYQLSSGTPAVTSLSYLGLQNVYQLVPNPGTATTPAWNPTFYPYTPNTTTGLPTSEPLSAVTYVAQLSGRAAAEKFGVPSTGTYLVFGLGKYSAMSGANGGGRYIQEAPVAYNMAGSGPDLVYCRFGLVFQVDPVNGAPATFIGAVEFEPTGAVTRDDNLIINGQTP
jgi:prepilin-type N-terminal cleavage/methylation domain-containing protein